MGGKSFEAVTSLSQDISCELRLNLQSPHEFTLLVCEWSILDDGPHHPIIDESLAELPFLPTETRLFVHHVLHC
jgi:hypothetical protein